MALGIETGELLFESQLRFTYSNYAESRILCGNLNWLTYFESRRSRDGRGDTDCKAVTPSLEAGCRFLHGDLLCIYEYIR
jgi:hypothetical protein